MVPRLDFNPALASTTIVPISHSVSRNVGLNFYVTMSRFWYDRFTQDGRRVEVWSNIPREGVPSHSWSEKAFVEHEVVKNEVVDLEDAEDAVAAISLIDEEYQAAVTQSRLSTEASDSGDRVTLVARFAIPQYSGTYYSFTFRLTGPGGHVEWLGNMGTNGTIILDGQYIRQVGLAEKEPRSWKVQDDCKTWEKEIDSDASEVEVAQFKDLGMTGWAFSQEGPKQISTASSTPASSFVLLHPDSAEQDSYPLVSAPSSLLITSDAPSSITIKDNSILATTGSNLAVKEFNSSSLDQVHSLVAGSTLGSYEVVHTSDDKNFIFVSSAPSTSFIPSSNPQKISIIPVVPQTSGVSVVSVPTGLLHALQPATPDITLYSESTDAVVNISGDYSHDAVKVTVGRNGGELTVVPSWTLRGESKDDQPLEHASWKISVIHPCVSPVNIVDVLPTPLKAPEPVEIPVETHEEPVSEEVIPIVETVQETPVSEEVQPAADTEVTKEKTAEVVVPEEPAPFVITPSKSTKRVGLFRLCFAKVMFWVRIFLQFWAAGWLFRAKPPKGTRIGRTEAGKVKEVPSGTEKEQLSSDPSKSDSKPLVDVSSQPDVPVELKGKTNELKTTMITPPITPPQSPLTTITKDPFSVPITASTPLTDPIAPIKQRLEFTLPPNAASFSYIIQGADAKNAAVMVDGENVADHSTLKIGKNPGSFIVTVDIPMYIKGDGRVEISC